MSFDSPADVPHGSVGYFTTEKEPVEAMKDSQGRWYLVSVHEGVALPSKTFEPKGHWVFTANSGPANYAAMRRMVMDELLQEEVGFTDEQANTVLGALHDKLGETEHYLSSYRDEAGEPGPMDSCCPAHRMRFEDRKRQRESLLARKKGVERLIRVFERYAHSLGERATRPSLLRQNAELRQTLHEAREAWWLGAEQGDSGVIYTDDVEKAMDAVWGALRDAERPEAVEQDELEAIADQVVWAEDGTAVLTEGKLVELLLQATRVRQ